MQFLVDAQLPRRLTRVLAEGNHDAIHTSDLPRGNRTADADLAEICRREHRVLITKDSDFVTSFLLERSPPRLLLVATGNITNHDLARLFAAQLKTIVQAFDSYAFVELGSTGLTLRG